MFVESDATAFDVMIAAAESDNSYDFRTSFFGEIGFFIEAVNGTANMGACFWYFYYQIPGRPVTLSDLGVSNVVVPGSGFTVILRYRGA